MEWKVQLCELNYDHRELDAVKRIVSNEWLTMGEESEKFEVEFSQFVGHENQGIFVSSATAGLHLILMAAGIGVGDEIIIPGLTFVSDGNVVVQLGAKPVLADSNSLGDLNVSAADILRKITPRTKAIVIVHFAGFPVDLEPIKQTCNEKNILLIEDCAHAPGAKLRGKMCGTLGDCAFFSFFSNKNLSIGEGGMVLCSDKKLSEKIRLMRSHGMSSVTLQRHKGRASSYDVLFHGLNYRADEMRAALGRVQLAKLEAGNLKRKMLYEKYVQNLSGTKVSVAFTDNDTRNLAAYHILPIILPSEAVREEIMAKLKHAGIQTSIHYPSFKDFNAFKSVVEGASIPIVDTICRRELSLPLHPRMKIEDVDHVTKNLLELL